MAKLTDMAIRKTKAGAATTKLSAGHSLYLVIPPTGAKWWRFDYRFEGKQKTISLGPYGTKDGMLGLEDARAEALRLRGQIRMGTNPSDVRKVEKSGTSGDSKKEAAGTKPPFRDVADEWLKTRPDGLAKKSAARDKLMVGYLKTGFRDAPGMGDIAISDIELKDLTPMLREASAPTRMRMQAAAKKVMVYAQIQHGLKASPFSDVNLAGGFKDHKPKKRPAIIEKTPFGQLLRAIDAYQGAPDNMTKIALKLLNLTVVRPGTVQKARWRDFDLKNARWTIPAEQLKMAHLREEIGAADDFIIPLSKQALQLLHQLHRMSGGGEYLFPGKQGSRTISENTLNNALIALGFKGRHCAHGFRSSFSSIMNAEEDKDENKLFPRHLIELALDHQDGTVRAVYDRDPAIGPRRRLMQFWADKVDVLRDGANVIQFPAAAEATG
jgi:integrase